MGDVGHLLHLTEETEVQRSPSIPLLPKLSSIPVLKGAPLPACERQYEFQFKAVRGARLDSWPPEPLKGPSHG